MSRRCHQFLAKALFKVAKSTSISILPTRKGPESKMPPKSGIASGYQQSKVSLVDRFIDDSRPLRLAVIGGGIAGILAGVLLPAKVEHLELVIFEKNSDLVRGLASIRGAYVNDANATARAERG